MIIDRDRYIDQLSRSKGNGLIKIITGLRRSGKSFLLKKLFRQHLLDEGIKENHILIIDMESRKNKEFKNPDHLLDWVEKMMEDDETYYIIIDEVQEVDDFVEVLSSLSVTDGTGYLCHWLQFQIPLIGCSDRVPRPRRRNTCVAPVVQRVHVGIQGHTRRGLGGIPFIWRFTAVAHADWR